MSFIRRYGYFPGSEVITEIEGVVIVDSPPPGRIDGVGTGVVACVGEFTDMTYATAVAATGAVSDSYRAIEAYSAQDLLDKFGGFDEFLGQFGGDLGSGYCAVAGKRFSRLVPVPINLTADYAVRLFRELPTCTTATNADPIVPMEAASVPAGTEFRSAALARIRTCASADFTNATDTVRGVDGAVTAAGAAATGVFNSAGADFVVDGVLEGDALVVGIIGDATHGDNAETYRVVSVAALALTVEMLDGSNFTWINEVAAPYRVHPAATFDTGGEHQLSEAAGYTVICRPLDSTVAASTALAPTDPAPAGSGTLWDSLSGLAMEVHATQACTYVAAKHAVNVATNATITGAYDSALAALLEDATPANEVNIVYCARKDTSIALALRAHVLTASAGARGCTAVIAPQVDVVLNTTAAVAAAWPGVGAYRHERVIYAWPGVQASFTDAKNFSIKGADANQYTDGILDTGFDGWVASALSNLAPERNPGQSSEPIPTVFAPILDFQRGLTETLAINSYKAMKQNGICGPHFSARTGTTIQSGVTTSTTSGRTNINRRRFADFWEDSIADRLQSFSKEPMSEAWKDSIESEIVAFGEDLLSTNNPAAQRIDGYEVDRESGNTAARLAAGIFVVIARARMTPTGDFIVLQAEVGENVTITTS